MCCSQCFSLGHRFLVVSLTFLLSVPASGAALAQEESSAAAPTGQQQMAHGSHATCPNHSSGASGGAAGAVETTELGQAAFAAVAEIAEILAGDPQTDWSRVDLDRLRSHLIDMNRVMIEARVHRSDLEGGFEAMVTGDRETAEAIHRMLVPHAAMVEAEQGWRVEIDVRSDGAFLRVTAAESGEAQRLKALGFAGFMAAGQHHGPHHLALARGGSPHSH